MNTRCKTMYLILLATLNFSCIGKSAVDKEFQHIELLSATFTDSLKFTSGVRTIFQDSEGTYWFGSHSEGLCFYDGKSFEYRTTQDGLPDNQVRSIQEDKKGIIWIETANGVCSYDRQAAKIHIEPERVASQSDWQKTDQDLWFNAGVRQGVLRYDGEKLTYLAFPNPMITTSGTSFGVTSSAKGKNNRLWIGTYAGVFGFDGNQLSLMNNEALGLSTGSEKLHVRSVFEDSKGRLWIGNNGIGVILKEGDSTIFFSKENGKLIPMKEFEANTLSRRFAKNTGLQSVFAIHEDHDGTIWFGDRDSGVWKYDGKLLSRFTIDSALQSQMVYTIYKDKTNNLLFGTASGGVYRWNGASFDKLF